MEAELRKEPTANEGTSDSNEKVADNPEPGALHNLTGQPSGNEADHQYDQETFTRHVPQTRVMRRNERRALLQRLNDDPRSPSLGGHGNGEIRSPLSGGTVSAKSRTNCKAKAVCNKQLLTSSLHSIATRPIGRQQLRLLQRPHSARSLD